MILGLARQPFPAGMDARRPPQNMDVLLADKKPGVPRGPGLVPLGLGRGIRSRSRKPHARGVAQPRRKYLVEVLTMKDSNPLRRHT